MPNSAHYRRDKSHSILQKIIIMEEPSTIYDVFISYSREDTNVVAEFIHRFEEEGLRVWVDLDGVESGDAFKRVIVKAIRNSSIVIFFSSASSNASEWTPKEIGVAIHFGKKVIPVKLDHTKYNDEIAFDLLGLDYIDYTNSANQKRNLEKLLNTLNKHSQESKSEQDEDGERQREKKKLKTRNYWLIGGCTALALCVLAMVLLFMKPDSGKKDHSGGEATGSTNGNITAAMNTGSNVIPSSGGGDFVVNGISFKMVEVQGGTFTMGCVGATGCDCYDEEKPLHQVTVSDFCIAETEVTQALWGAVMGYNHSGFQGDELPVESVTWDECQQFIAKLNGMTGRKFRLPTEAEWEYAARGGNKSKEAHKYSGSNSLSEVGWYDDNSGGDSEQLGHKQTHPVKKKWPNELGLYDMSGNVCEWCNDWYTSYDTNPQINPQGAPDDGSSCFRVRRGGNWLYGARFCRVSYRYSGKPVSTSNYVGFRLALEP